MSVADLETMELYLASRRCCSLSNVFLGTSASGVLISSCLGLSAFNCRLVCGISGGRSCTCSWVCCWSRTSSTGNCLAWHNVSQSKLNMLSTLSASLRETNAIFLFMFATLLLVFNIGIFNLCGNLFSNLCTTHLLLSHCLVGETCSLFLCLICTNVWWFFNWNYCYGMWASFYFTLVFNNWLYCGCGNALHNHLPINRLKVPTFYIKACTTWYDLCFTASMIKSQFGLCSMTNLSLYVCLHIFICRKHSPLGISASSPAPLSVLLHFVIFGLSVRLSKNFVEMTLILAPMLNSAVAGWSLTLTLYRIRLVSSPTSFTYTSFMCSHSESMSSNLHSSSACSSE